MDEYKLMNKSQMKERINQYYWNRSNMPELKVLCDLYVEYFGDLDEDEVRDVKFKQGYANFDVDRDIAILNFEQLLRDPKLNEETRMFTQFNLTNLYPKNPDPIPKIIHLLYFGETEFYNYHSRCVKSVITNMPNHKIFIYNSKEPVNNPLWDEIKQYPQIEVKPIQVPEYFDGFKLTHFQYKADVVRLEVLYEHGGIYLDLDMLIIKNFEELFESNKDFYISKECSDHNGLINAFIACKPKNEFIKIWLDNFKSGLRMNNWAYHIRDTNRLLLEKNPHFKIKYNIEIIDYHHFFPINFSDTEIFENKKHHNFNKTTYGIHLWETILHNILIDGTFLPGIEDKLLINDYEYVNPFHNKKSNQLLSFLNTYTGSAWLGHLKFAMWLVYKYNPKVIVELGMDYGHSSFALASEGIGNVYGIDCFDGDIHAGERNTYQLLLDTKKYLLDTGLLVKDNLHIIKGYFSEIYKTFEHEIDILHIDGLHTYEAVSEDFNTWINKTHDNSIIIMHDVISFKDTVGKFFDEIPYPKTFFWHSAGLGIVCKNQLIIDEINMSFRIGPYKNIPYIPKKYCFIHSCYTYTYGTNVLNKLLISLNNVKDQFEKIFIVNIGDNLENDMLMFNNEKIEIINYSNNIALFEAPTLNLIHTFCENMDENCEILYLHTKGITCQDNENVMDWIDMMKYFVIDQHDNCSKLLKSHDSVGCNYSAQPYKHFSGNFWWANSNYIKQKLTKIYSDKKHINEWWICSGNDVNSFNLHNSGINHYNTRYTADKYNDSLYRIM